MAVTAKPAPAATAKPGRRKANSRSWLLRPAIIYLIIVTQVPFLMTLYFSTSNWNLLRPARTAFIGLRNYLQPFQNSEFLVILGNTLVLTLSVVVLSLAFGLLLAMLLNRSFPGRSVLRTLLITPFLIMPTVTAVIWKNVLLNPAFGLIASLSVLLGGPRVDWLAQYAMQAVIVIVIWEWTPFMMLILLAGLQSLPQEPLEAARIDGANFLGLFRHIILPFLTRYIEIAVLLETLFVLSIFGEIFVTTSGGPGIATTNLAYDIYMEAFQRWNIGRASALGVFAVILANIVVTLFLRVLRHDSGEKGAE
jgi:sorbitol/mannitol transport system permease protein